MVITISSKSETFLNLSPSVPVLIIAEDDPASHFFVRSAVVWMNDFVVLVLIFGNLVYAVRFSKSHGQITGAEKRKVSKVLRSLEPRRGSLNTSRRYSNEGQSGQIGNHDKAMGPKVSIESDMESGSAVNDGTLHTSGSLDEMLPALVSDISLSGFETSSQHDDKYAVPYTPLSAESKAISAARWVPSPSLEKLGQMNSHGPALPTRVDSVIEEQPEATSFGIPYKTPISNSSDEGDIDSLQAGEQQNYISNKQEFQDALSGGPDRLTSIAELEWSDDEDKLTNQTPPALLESASPEKAPVMPVR